MGVFTGVAIHKRVVVNLDDGTAVHGVFYRQRGPLIILGNASLLEPGTDPVPLDGEVIIERTRVRFIQAP